MFWPLLAIRTTGSSVANPAGMRWSNGAALPDFQWDRLRGTLKLQVGPGQLRDINPGFWADDRDVEC